MAGTGQTINDRLNAVKFALVGQGLARTVCKSTTEEVIGPKKKHLDYLLVCTQEPNVSVPQLANLLIERTQHASWAVVFKGLITIHYLMSNGNERFTQYLATSNHSFDLPEFMDRSTPQGYNMSTFVRRYSKYINEKCKSYRFLAIDLCKLGSGNDNPLRTMNMDKLSKTLPHVHNEYELLLDFGAETKDLNNGIILASFRLLYKDLVKLYVVYQEAIINLLERYFKLSRKKTREALNLYKSYLSLMDKVATFLRVADAIGIDKSEMPDLTKSPASILTLLQEHLAQLEAKKKGSGGAGGNELTVGGEATTTRVSPAPKEDTDTKEDTSKEQEEGSPQGQESSTSNKQNEQDGQVENISTSPTKSAAQEHENGEKLQNTSPKHPAKEELDENKDTSQFHSTENEVSDDVDVDQKSEENVENKVAAPKHNGSEDDEKESPSKPVAESIVVTKSPVSETSEDVESSVKKSEVSDKTKSSSIKNDPNEDDATEKMESLKTNLAEEDAPQHSPSPKKPAPPVRPANRPERPVKPPPMRPPPPSEPKTK